MEFRYVNGRCIPLHVDGGCSEYAASPVNDYSGTNRTQEYTCFPTKCPECGDNVFFLRHNGGSVWVDPPLGWPWYKHSCFNTEATEGQDTLALDYAIDATEPTNVNDAQLVIGVVKSTEVRPNKRMTDAIVDTGGASRLGLKVKNNAGYLFGKLVVVENHRDIVFPVRHPDHRFEIISKRQLAPEYVNCTVCGVILNFKNVRRHMKLHDTKM
ncbi:hypothetical protein [Congregibacter litoralis]|uniref:hypothetical protein n=1 Tax=Congregibacter litoralis TaxID=393662 RepID=UPI001930B323|nr:hypothetical protein [Congregibacter litoralis]